MRHAPLNSSRPASASPPARSAGGSTISKVIVSSVTPSFSAMNSRKSYRPIQRSSSASHGSAFIHSVRQLLTASRISSSWPFFQEVRRVASPIWCPTRRMPLAAGSDSAWQVWQANVLPSSTGVP